jgi:hypothetical protein
LNERDDHRTPVPVQTKEAGMKIPVIRASRGTGTTRFSLLLVCVFLAVTGCSKPNSKVEQQLQGEWKEEGEGFFVTFSENHLGTVDFKNKKQPFAWIILADGRIQVTDPAKQVFYLKFSGNKLYIEGTKSVLSRIK